MELTPEQQAKCMLLDIELDGPSQLIHYRKHRRRAMGWMVRRINGQHLHSILGDDSEAFDNADDAINAAIDPAAYECKWETYGP